MEWRKAGGPVVFGLFLAYRVFVGGGDGSSFDMKPGVCVDDLMSGTDDRTGEVLVEETSCDQPHDGEIYYVVPSRDWASGASGIAGFKALDEACVEHFAGYVGVDMAGSTFGTAFLGEPTEAGDIACMLLDQEGPMTGSRRDWGDTRPDGTDRALSSLAVGDCFMGVEEQTMAFAVDNRTCEEPHDGEVFALLRLPGGTYPTGDVEGDTNERCLSEFASYVGLAYEDSVLGLMGVPPSPSTWAFGDRQVICMLGRIDGEPLTSSMQGAGV